MSFKGTYMDAFDFCNRTHMVTIKLNHLWVLKLISQILILGLVILSFPWINTVIRGLTSIYGYTNVSKEVLPFYQRRLLKTGDRLLLITNGNEDVIYNSQVTRDYNMDLISLSNLARKEEAYDVALFPYDSFKSVDFIDRTLKVGGIVVHQINNDNFIITFSPPSIYKVVYVRKFHSMIIAMRKTSSFVSVKSTTIHHHRKSFNFGPKAKEDALKKLEDVLLEPPRAASEKSSRYLKKTRYLPDLMDIPLESYLQRVFIDVGLLDKNENSGDSMAKEPSLPLIGMSDWLEKNVKENEYVVMKAEAEVVEEMVRNKAIKLVDELFLECKHQGLKKGDENRSRRAYWECLSLYGTLRDEGVAVHQWWG
ncbi:unnamed protein product [Withania somnifera]